MANLDNLVKPFEKGRSSEEAAKAGRKGGIASGKARREKKLLKEEILKRMSAKDWKELCDNAIERAKEDDQAFKTLRDTIGQKPVEKVEVSGAIDESVREMEAYLNGRQEKADT